MNILINTPFLTSNPIKENFDNNVLAVFLVIIFTLLILGLIFINLIRNYYPQESIDSANSSNSTSTKITESL